MESWEKSQGNPFVDKLTYCSTPLDEWGRKLARHFKGKIEKCKHKLYQLQSSGHLMDEAKYNNTKNLFNDLLDQEEDHWKQRAKCHWLEGGGSNSRFFHAMASTRNRTNRIEKLRNSEGVWVSNQEDLCSVAESYFSLLFAADLEWQEPNLSFISTKISREDNAKLVIPFSIDEFKHALFLILDAP